MYRKEKGIPLVGPKHTHVICWRPRIGLEDRLDVQCALWVIKCHVKPTTYGQGEFLICQPTWHTRYNNKELIRSLLEMLVKANGQTSYQRKQWMQWKQEQVLWRRPISYEYTLNITFKSLSKLGFL